MSAGFALELLSFLPAVYRLVYPAAWHHLEIQPVYNMLIAEKHSGLTYSTN